MMTRSTVLAVAVAVSALGVACATAPIASGQRQDPDTGDGTGTGTGAKNTSTAKDTPTTPTPPKTTTTTASSCTTLKACANRITGTDATAFGKVAAEGDSSTCTKALGQCQSELKTTTTTTPDAGTTGTSGCTALSDCCDQLYANQFLTETDTCDSTVTRADENACGTSLASFMGDGLCI